MEKANATKRGLTVGIAQLEIRADGRGLVAQQPEDRLFVAAEYPPLFASKGPNSVEA